MKNKPILLIILITMICSLNPSTRVTAQSSNAKVVVRRSNGNAFTANEDWTQGAY